MAEAPIQMPATPVTGGCRCGAVRCALGMEPQRTHSCRATGDNDKLRAITVFQFQGLSHG